MHDSAHACYGVQMAAGDTTAVAVLGNKREALTQVGGLASSSLVQHFLYPLPNVVLHAAH